VATSMSRRRVVTMSAAATATGALPPVSGTTAEAASLTPADEPDRVFDVRRFGAMGDGVTIDSAAVNRAIGAAVEAGPSGSRGPGDTVVDGGLLEDGTVSNITMRRVRMPIFMRLGSRMRGRPAPRSGLCGAARPDDCGVLEGGAVVNQVSSRRLRFMGHSDSAASRGSHGSFQHLRRT